MKKSLFVVGLICLYVSAGHTQVVRDGTIGPDASLQPRGPTFEITEAMGETAGSNLFHSFSLFSFGSQESVLFQAGNSIANIFARVTGGVPSSIGGRLAAPTNLFLINPFGFMFEKNLRIDVAGAFYAATNDYLEFGAGERFSASPARSSVLSVADPRLFGFLDSNPRAPIVVRSDLVSSGNAILLIGGPVSLANGRIFVQRTDGFSNVTIDRGAEDLRLNHVYIRGGKISLNGGDIDVRGSALFSVTHDSDGGGADVIDGQDKRVGVDIQAAGRIAIDGTVIGSDTSGDGRGGDIRIRGAGDVVVSGGSDVFAQTEWKGPKRVVPVGSTPFPVTIDKTDLRGDGGEIVLSAGRDLIVQASTVDTQNLGDGAGGGVSLSAGRDVRVQDASRVESHSGFSFTGPVFIEAGRDVRLTDSTVKSDAAPDFYGRRSRPEAIFVSAPNGVISLQRSTISTRAEQYADLPYPTIPGPITLDSKIIELTATSSVNASDVRTNFETGGSITFNATDRINISGSSVESSGLGRPGLVQITAPRITVTDASRIESINIAGNDPGRISVRASDQLVVADSAIRADGGLFPGRVTLAGGDITLTRANVTSVVSRTEDISDQDSPFGIDITARNLRVEGGAITARSDSAAPAGNITMAIADSLNVSDDAHITTTSSTGAGGDITLTVGSFLQAIDSEISTSVLGGAGGGGNIAITMGGDSDLAVMVLERSRLTAQAVQGRGGNMTIVTGLFVASGEPETLVSASSQLGIAGEVQIDAPDASIVGTLTTLPAVFLDAAALIRERCTAERADHSASLFVRGRGGVPPAPDGLLPGIHTSIAPVAALSPGYVGTVVGETRDGRPVLLAVRCGKYSDK